MGRADSLAPGANAPYVVKTGATTRTTFRAMVQGVWVTREREADVAPRADTWMVSEIPFSITSPADFIVFQSKCLDVERVPCRMAWERVLALREAKP